jgi:hypothetical protein
MKKIALIALVAVLAISCKNDDDGVAFVNVDFSFTHNWNGTDVNSSDFGIVQYTNANGEMMSIERLRYVISAVHFQSTSGQTVTIDGYNLVDVTNNTNLTFDPVNMVPTGNYQNVSFTFGFSDADNEDGIYTDLNAANWNVPMMMGGGYHYMQLEGKFVDNTSTLTGYQYHTIRANDMSTTPVTLQDTSFEVDLGPVTISNDASIEIKMNIAQWFANPNQWDLNLLHSLLMPNFNAQIMMSENGQNGVFSLGTVSQ